jgi:hypothetical protein
MVRAGRSSAGRGASYIKATHAERLYAFQFCQYIPKLNKKFLFIHYHKKDGKSIQLNVSFTEKSDLRIT